MIAKRLRHEFVNEKCPRLSSGAFLNPKKSK